MIALLIFLYVLMANGVIVPTGCLVATWVLVAVGSIAKLLNAALNYADK